MSVNTPKHVRVTHMGNNVTLVRKPEFARDIARKCRLIESGPNVRYYRSDRGETFRVTSVR